MKNLAYINCNGYYQFKDSNTLVHRWAAEKKLGRKLKPEEVVHHIDRNKLNNYPYNLYICKNQQQHDRIHEIDAMRFGWEVSFVGFKKRRNDFFPMDEEFSYAMAFIRRLL